MKHTRKLYALLLALTLVLSLAGTAFAADETYSITVKKTSDEITINGKTFSAYKIFDVTYTEGNSQAVTYTIDPEFSSFTYKVGDEAYQGDRFTNPAVDGKDLSLVAYLESVQDDSDDLNKFAKAVNEYLKENSTITADGTAEAANETATINLTAPGYYIVTGSASPTEDANQTVVAACALTTAKPNAEVNTKADVPQVDKSIEGADDTTSSNATADDIGKKVDFKVTAKVPDLFGYDQYTFVIHDTMSKGLTPEKAEGSDKPIDVSVTIGGKEYKSFTVEQERVQDSDGFNFKVTFDQFLEDYQAGTIKKDQEIVVTYSATINKEALTTKSETNEADIEYSNDPYSDTTNHTPGSKVYVYDFDIVVDKYAADETLDNVADNEKLSDAVFVLKNTTTGSENNGKYYKVDETTGVVTWADVTVTGNGRAELIEALESAVTAETITAKTTDDKGATTFAGLDTGTYELIEIQAPDGYNLLTENVEVEITATYKADGTLDSSSADIAKDGQLSQVVQVENKSGTELPSTGGVGTTIFYIAGGALALAALILLVTKKRMTR